jgi:hypothetical protein
MALFRIFKGKEEDLETKMPDRREGFAYFTTDENDFYIDTDSSVKNSDGTFADKKESARKQLNANRTRYVKSKDLKLYIDTEEISLGRYVTQDENQNITHYESYFEDINNNAEQKAGLRSIAVGNQASALGNYASSLGDNTKASGKASHAEGDTT